MRASHEMNHMKSNQSYNDDVNVSFRFFNILKLIYNFPIIFVQDDKFRLAVVGLFTVLNTSFTIGLMLIIIST